MKMAGEKDISLGDLLYELEQAHNYLEDVENEVRIRKQSLAAVLMNIKCRMAIKELESIE